MACPVDSSGPGGTTLLSTGASRVQEPSDEPVFVSDVEHAPVAKQIEADPPEREEPPEEASPEETAPEETSPEETPPEGTPPEGGYKGDFTYVVKGQQRVLPDWAQAAVKDDASHKAVREIFEKAEGFEHVKTDRDNLQQWYEQVQPTMQQVQMLNTLLSQKNYGAFFQGVGIPLQEVLNFSLQYAQMDPNQRAGVLAQSQQVFDQYHQQMQSQNAMNGYQNQLVQAREREVNLLLSRPDVQQVAQQLDQRLGRFGALRQEVINRGQYYAAQGQDRPAEELLNEILSFTGVQIGGPPTTPQQNTHVQGGGGQPSPAGTGPVPQNRGTMSNLRGSGHSPARKVIRSRKDLIERAKQLEAQGR